MHVFSKLLQLVFCALCMSIVCTLLQLYILLPSLLSQAVYTFLSFLLVCYTQWPPGTSSGGVTYVRWGRTTCPNTTGTELVYTGRAAGSHYTHSGGGGNYQCIVGDPENFDYGAGTTPESYIYGAEYQMFGNIPSSYHQLNNHDVPCSICYVASRNTVLMIPGKYTCPQNWTREYYGFLMAERHAHHRSTFECVDVAPETITGGQADQDGALFYHVEPRCGSLPCPPYDQQKEMTCAVCTR